MKFPFFFFETKHKKINSVLAFAPQHWRSVLVIAFHFWFLFPQSPVLFHSFHSYEFAATNSSICEDARDRVSNKNATCASDPLFDRERCDAVAKCKHKISVKHVRVDESRIKNDFPHTRQRLQTHTHTCPADTLVHILSTEWLSVRAPATII